MNSAALPFDKRVPNDQYDRISVIIPSFNSGTTIARTLETLQDQEQPGDYEVIVVDSSDDGAVADLVPNFPVTRLIRLERRAYPGNARNIGVAAATGEILAFTDADCMVGRDWIRTIRTAHQTGVPVIGGTIANGNPERLFGWMYYFCKLSHWLPNSQRIAVKEIPTACLTMKRFVFDQYGPFLEDCYSSDTAFNWAVAAQLGPPVLSSAIEVRHINCTRVGTVVCKLYRHGRDFARLRVSAEGWSGWRRLLFVLGSPLLPGMLFWRTARNVYASRIYLGRFVAYWPLVLAGWAVWGVGEAAGCLFPARRQSSQT